MALTDRFLTIKEALEFLALNGLERSESWLRLRIWGGRIKSEKRFSSRVVERAELERVLRMHGKIQ